MRPALKLAPALIALAFAPSLARAQVSPENAQALEKQIHDWLSELIGPLVDVPDRPVTLEPKDDHYHVTLPLADALGGLGLDAPNATFTAEARPLPGDRWALDDIRIPNLKVQVPDGMPGGPLTWSMNIAEQHIRAVIDPDLATATTFDAEISGQTSTTEGQDGAHASAVEHYEAHSVWMPVGDGRVDILSTTDGEKMKASQIMPDGTPVNWSVGRLHGSMRIDRVAAASFIAMIREAMNLAPMFTEAQQSGHLAPAARQRTKALLLQVRNLMGGVRTEESLEDLHVESSGLSGSLRKLVIGFGAGADGGKIDFRLNLALDGVDSPAIPAGPLRQYLPQHVAIDPRLSGVPVEDATQLLMAAIDSDQPDPDALQAQALALLKKSPVTVAIDHLDLDLGPAKLHGGGGVEISAPDRMTGDGTVSIVGLDALMKQAATVPDLKAALPVLIMLKGLGHQQGNTTTWRIRYAGDKVMVNDTDLSAMLPGMK
jgi:hypothetical protein